MPRSKLDDIVEEIRTLAGADFAFVLTRRGRLITGDAPREMPEAGRMRLVRAARPLIGTSQTLQVTLARQELVPFGGAAPVDVYLAVAREQAILCLVMSTWGDKREIIPAMQTGLAELEPVLDRRDVPKAKGSERGRPSPPTSRPPPGTSRPPPRPGPQTRSSAPPGKTRRRGAMSGLVGLMGGVATPSRSLEQAPVIQNARTPPPPPPGGSMPEIRFDEGVLGRESLEAIERDEHDGSIPDIQIGEGAALGRDSVAAINRELQTSLPEILVGEARLGTASLAAIEAASRIPNASTPDVRLELASISRASVADIARAEAENAERDIYRPDPTTTPSMRLTNPWSEAAVDSARTVDAQRKARAVQPPRVSLKLESLDEEVLEAALVEELEQHVASRLAAPAPAKPVAARPATQRPPPLPQKPATQRPPPLPQRPATQRPPPLPPRPAPKAKAAPVPAPGVADDAPDIEVDGPRPPQSSYEVWADAIDEVTSPGFTSKKSKRR